MASPNGEVKHKTATPVAGDAPVTVVYVTIPERDIYDYRFPDVWINEVRYPSGHTYALEPNTAKQVQELVVNRQKHDLGLMSSRVNLDALRQLAGGETSTKAANNGASVPVFDAGRLDAAGIHV